MRNIVVCIATCAIVSACATSGSESDVAAARESWDGARYEAVVAQWGAPQHQAMTPDGRTAYSWNSRSTGAARSGAAPSFSVFGSSGMGVGAGIGVGSGGGDTLRCDRTVYVQNNIVVEQKWNGNPRYCRTFARY